MSINVAVSIGEALDKLSILEIKQRLILNEEKNKAITHEISCLQTDLNSHMDKLYKYYIYLKWINQEIWNMSDRVRLMKMTDIGYSQLMYDIFVANESRFIIKNMINNLSKSEISEQKNYESQKCLVLHPTKMETLFNLSGVIQWLNTQFNIVDVVINENNKKKYINECTFMCCTKINLISDSSVVEKNNYDCIFDWTLVDNQNLISIINIPQHVYNYYMFWLQCCPSHETINYVVSGLLGDMIHSLYVIMVMFLKTGKKGVLYITDNRSYGGEPFTKGANQTYADTFDIIKNQFYVKDYFLLSDKDTGLNMINLNIWRHREHRYEWNSIMSLTYGIEKLPISWLYIPSKFAEYFDVVLIHRSVQRHLLHFPYKKIIDNNKCVFITCNQNEYDAFPYKNDIKLVLCPTLSHMATMISSCKFFVGNQSSPAAFAYSMKKPSLLELFEPQWYKGNEFYTELYWIDKTSTHLCGIEKFITGINNT